LGKLSLKKFTTLKLLVSHLLIDVAAYEVVTPPECCPQNLKPLVKWLEHSLVQLASVYITFWQTEFIVWDMQHVWLELKAILNYMQTYKPQMDGHTPAAGQVADTIGVFTTSV
jgi:hypothetical protein